MGSLTQQPTVRQVLELSGRQHDVITHAQLRSLGLSDKAIAHRLRRGRIFAVHRGVYAVGRPKLTRRGRWKAATLACGDHAVLSHESAAALWGVRDREVSTEATTRGSIRGHAGVRAHRSRTLTPANTTTHHGIPVTTPARTLIDLAARLPEKQIEDAMIEADVLDLIDPPALRAALGDAASQPGVARLKRLYDRHTLELPREELERRMFAIARAIAVPPPETQHERNGARVDFCWPDIGLIVETDGQRYHRHPARQTADRRKDQRHIAAGDTPLRFTHAQVFYDADEVGAILDTVHSRLSTRDAAEA
jgi:predicted transcriptional regulator of viral defense system